MCVSLQEHGYDVTLVTRHSQAETIKGVKIHPLPERKNKSRVIRFLYSFLDGYRAVGGLKPDIVHFHDPELLLLVPLLKFQGIKTIYDVHEDVPQQILAKEYIFKPVRRFVSFLCRLAETISASMLTGVVATTSVIANRFSDKKTIVVQNFPIIGNATILHQTPYPARPSNITYHGAISEFRGITEMVKAMELLENLEIRMMLAGKFETELLKEKITLMSGWSRVDFLGWQSREQIGALLNQTRAGLVVLHPVVNYVVSQPVKMYEYMLAGIPVIASDFPLWREIIEGNKCGLLVDPLDPQAIADAVQWVLDNPIEAEDMGKNGREAVLNLFNWEAEVVKLIDFYEKLKKTSKT
jgi:glycosyltransferase involved in cell wall biosynthesis